MQLDKASGSTSAGFLYGCKDSRLRDENLNLFNLQNGIDSSYIEVVLDIEPLLHGQESQLHLYRVGYIPTDSIEKPLHSFVIPQSLINQDNAYSPHTFTI